MKSFLSHFPLWAIVLLVGIIFVVVGVFQGGFEDALRKAIRVCYECIGIG